MSKTELAVIVPVFNEEVSVGRVLAEWRSALNSTAIRFKFFVVNDGSKDNTPSVLKEFKNKNPEIIEIIDQPNQGHGQACINGYRVALNENIEWIFQIDSDGQCDPKFFNELWTCRDLNYACFGKRISRDDGQIRMYVSKVLSLAIFFGMRVWVRDSNVPFRLMPAAIVKKHINKIPRDFFLANALMTALIAKYDQIRWFPIHFRDRFGGSPSLQGLKLFKRGASIFGDFYSYREPAIALDSK